MNSSQPGIDPLPARSLEDLSLDETVTGPDFKLGERYLDLSKELSRLALLGIAGYGFLIKEIAMKGESSHPFLSYMVHHPYLPLLGLFSLGLSAAASLLTSQISTNCMKLQIDIVRYVKRRTNPGWTEEERQHNDLYLEGKTHVAAHVHQTRSRLSPNRRASTHRRNSAHSPKLRAHPVDVSP